MKKFEGKIMIFFKGDKIIYIEIADRMLIPPRIVAEYFKKSKRCKHHSLHDHTIEVLNSILKKR